MRWRYVGLGLGLLVIAAGALALTLEGHSTEQAEAAETCSVWGIAFGGGGTVSGGARVTCGETVTLTATAKEGYCFSHWSGEPPSEGCPRSSEKHFVTTEGTYITGVYFKLEPATTPTPTPTPTATPEPTVTPPPTPTATPTATATPSPTPTPESCADGAIKDTEKHTRLVEDCNLLLSLRDTLAGSGTLNWAGAAHISTWDGVTYTGSPLRITKLELASKGLSGTIPSELASLDALTHLYLTGNALTGCIPNELWGLPNNDLGTLMLGYCPTPETLPLDDAESGGEIPAGTYQIENTDLIIDVPLNSIGVYFSGWVVSIDGVQNCVSSVDGSRLCLFSHDGSVSHRSTSGATESGFSTNSVTPSVSDVDAAFDHIVGSVRFTAPSGK